VFVNARTKSAFTNANDAQHADSKGEVLRFARETQPAEAASETAPKGKGKGKETSAAETKEAEKGDEADV
jgi:hypothetical protein